MLVLDATPLIYLATVDRLDLLERIPHECVVPQPVYDEVVTAGLEAGHPDARRVERAVEGDVLTVAGVGDPELGERLERDSNLSTADVAVIALAAANDGVAVIDERYGRATAEAEGVETRGTVSLLLALVRDGTLSGEAAREVLDGMVAAGWYCSTDLYARVVRTFESIE